MFKTLLRLWAVVLRRDLEYEAWLSFARSQDGTFDQQFNVDTAGVVRLRDLPISSESWTNGGDYQATPAAVLGEMVERLSIEHDQYTFVDLGSGKGKALLLAAAYQFKKIIGVEFSPELCDIARQNIERYTGPRRCHAIEVICADVASYQLPDSPLVVYLYNPFGESVMAAAIANIESALAAGVSPIFVAYCHPLFQQLFNDAGFQTLAEGEGYKIWSCANLAASTGCGRGTSASA